MTPLISSADKLYFGGQPVSKLYLGTQRLWPSAAAFSPASLSGLAVWFDASKLALADGAAVDPWPNLGAGPTGALRGAPAPKLRTNALKGLPVVRFIANEGRIRIVSGSGVTSDWTLIYVGRIWGATPGRVVDGVYPPNNILVGFWNGNQDVMYDAGFTTNSYVPWTTDWKMYSGDGVPGLSRLYSDGTLLGSTTTGQGWGGTLSLSGYGQDTAEESCDCEIAEVCQYNRLLSDAERQQVEGYLRGKWMS